MGHSISFMLYMIAKHPEAQEKIHREIMSLLKAEGQMNQKFLQDAKYLRACIQESFR